MIPGMSDIQLQALCERGQAELMQTQYLLAARTLAQAEQQAWDSRDFDTLSRLYLPLQEARRQIRQRCSEGAVALHCYPQKPTDIIAAERLVEAFPTGQMLCGGWGSIQPAVGVRRLAFGRSLYLETFLAAVYPIIDSDPVVVIAPVEEASLPAAERGPVSILKSKLPIGCLILTQPEIPSDARVGSADTFAGVMSLWERLHTPFLEAAANEPDPHRRMQAYRLALRVDPACELAHQFLADIARTLRHSSAQ